MINSTLGQLATPLHSFYERYATTFLRTMTILIILTKPVFSGTGVAYTTLNMKEPIVVRNWPGTDNKVGKVPTAICYREGQKGIHSWGFECPSFGELESRQSVDEHFKLFLQPNALHKERQTTAEYHEDVQMWVFDYLKALNSHVVSQISDHLKLTDWTSTTVHYALSIPEIWDKTAVDKAFRRVVMETGLGKPRSHSIEIELREAEAAAVYTATQQQLNFEAEDGEGTFGSCNEGPDPQAAETILVCDCGGGTVVSDI
jgi:hypothetical protein